MKTNYKIHFALILPFALASISAQSQAPPGIDEEYRLFQKGTSIVNLLPNIGFSSLTTDQNPEVTTNNFNINLRGNYYAWDNIGIVGGVYIDNQVIKTEGGTDQSTKLAMVEVGAQYGRYVASIPLRGELSLGFGSYKVNDNSAATLAYNINVSTFIEVGNSGAYIEPFMGYAGFRNNFKESDFVNSTGGLVAGACFVKPMGCGDYICGFGDDAPFEPYAKGTNRLQFLQQGALGIGSNKRDFMEGAFVQHDGLFGLTVNLADYYYVADNLAAGLGVEVANLTRSDKDSEFKTSSTDLFATPRLRYHTPVQGALNGLFADGGVLFGTNTQKTTDAAGNDYETKTGTFGWNIGLGYDVFFSENFSVTGVFDYVNKKNTDKDTDSEYVEAGTRFLLGVSYTF